MPTYEYRCKSCEHRFDAVQSFTDDPLTECPQCGGVVKKVFGSVGITFKGSGFYKTDSRAGAAANGGKDGSGGDKESSGTADSGSGTSGDKTGASSGSEGSSSSSSTSSTDSSSSSSKPSSSPSPKDSPSSKAKSA